MMAIVSKAVFEKRAPKAKPGTVLPWRVYSSASKHLERLDKKSRLFLMTVRPPDEALWLVAVLEGPQFDDDKWIAARNTAPIVDIGSIKSKLQFESGKGLAAKKGALGMSLQTPRVLAEADVALLLTAVSDAKAAAPAKVRQARPVNLAAHEKSGPLPCLCHKCLSAAPETLELDGAVYLRAKVEVVERLLWFWVPADLKEELPAVLKSVQGRLMGRLKPWKTEPTAS